MRNPLSKKHFWGAMALLIVLLISNDHLAQQVGEASSLVQGRIVIRQMIPDPHALKRSPLTSDRLSTASTRLIDARRGLRPYSSVYGGCASYHRYAVYEDHFGISRPENRPWSYAQRTPRTSVTQFSRPPRATDLDTANSTDLAYTPVRIDLNDPVILKPMTMVRVHRDRSVTPKSSGAVLITSDGTVLQIGD